MLLHQLRRSFFEGDTTSTVWHSSFLSLSPRLCLSLISVFMSFCLCLLSIVNTFPFLHSSLCLSFAICASMKWRCHVNLLLWCFFFQLANMFPGLRSNNYLVGLNMGYLFHIWILSLKAVFVPNCSEWLHRFSIVTILPKAQPTREEMSAFAIYGLNSHRL